MTPGAQILVIALEDLPVGYTFSRTRQDWPLHVTVLNWFMTPQESSILIGLAQLAATISPFVIRVGQDAMFGADGDVPVSLFEDDTELKLLHKQLLKTVLDGGGSLSQETLWVGDDYTPHATHHGNKQVQLGDDFIVSRVCVVTALENNRCEVTRYIPLIGEDSWQ